MNNYEAEESYNIVVIIILILTGGCEGRIKKVIVFFLVKLILHEKYKTALLIV